MEAGQYKLVEGQHLSAEILFKTKTTLDSLASIFCSTEEPLVWDTCIKETLLRGLAGKRSNNLCNYHLFLGPLYRLYYHLYLGPLLLVLAGKALIITSMGHLY